MRSLRFGICLLTAYCLLLTAVHAALDLTEIGVGARVLGMGKAAIGLVEDGSAIFVNPAGLSLNGGLNITSMQGNLLQDVGYVMFGISEKSPYGSLGLGIVRASVAGIPLTTWSGTSVESYGSTDYSSSVIVFSYGNQFRNIRIGGNVKYFSQGFSATTGSMEGGVGSGFDLDLGAQWSFNRWGYLGLVFQNVLPASLGGKFIWQRGSVEEGVPLLIKLGTGLKLLGPEGLRKLGDHELVLAVDWEKYYSGVRPSLWHVGLEWWPLPIFALRTGIDQKPKSEATVDNNLTAGVGLKYKGFTFDVAYHQFGELTENATYFFSLGYVGEEKKVKALGKIPEELEGIPSVRVVPKPKLKTFSDVPENFWAKNPIEYLATLDIMGGYEDNTFRPENFLSRAELAALLVKAKGFKKVEKVTKKIFSDLPAAHWAAPYIEIAIEKEYVSGYPDGTFKPDEKITRAEAAAVFAKFSGLYVKPEIKEKPFPDLPKLHWASPAVAAIKQEGFLEYLSGKDFDSSRSLTRAEAAEILSKVPFIKAKIKKLISEGK